MHPLKYLLSSTLLVLAACAPGPKQPADGRGGRATFQDRFARELVDATWTPDAVTVQCGSPNCPPQVGVLITATPSRDARGRLASFNLQRCTASLVAADRALTAAHCLKDGAETYLILPGGRARVTGVLFKAYAGLNADNQPVQSPDLALLQLDRPIPGVTPLPLARGARPTYRSLTAYVVNHQEKNAFRIDRLDCAVRRDPRFPFDVTDNPDLIHGYDCTARKGNSGSPLFGPDGAVEAVLQDIGLNDPVVVGANVRCLPLDQQAPATCTRTGPKDIARRNERAQLAGWDAAGRAEPADTYAYRFNRFRLRQKGTAERFEVVYAPKCLRANEREPTELTYISDLIASGTDASGKTTTTTLERRLTTARVIERQGDRYKVEADWQPPFGPLEEEQKHPSVYLGRAFTVDLPRCAR